MASTRTKSGKISKRDSPVGRGQDKKSGKEPETSKAPRPSPPVLPAVRVSYKPQPLRALYPDRVKIVAITCSQPTLHEVYPEMVTIKVELLNLTPESQYFELRAHVHDTYP